MDLLLALMPVPRQRYWVITADGVQPNALGYFKFYEAGTSTPLDVYANSDGSTSLGTQVDLDADGYAPTIYLLAVGYKLELYDADDAIIFTQDNVFSFNGEAAAGLVNDITALVTGNNNDVALTDDATLLPLNCDGLAYLTGLTGGVSNRRVVLINIGLTGFFQILSQNAASAAENRFAGASVAVNPGQGIQIVYYGDRWYPVS